MYNSGVLCILVLLVQFLFFLLIYSLFQIGKKFHEKYNKKYTKYFTQHRILKNQNINRTKYFY